MVIGRKKIEISVTNEELKYGLTHFMDEGMVNTYSSNQQKELYNYRSYLYHRLDQDEFYIEDKRFTYRLSNSNFVGYKLRNYPRSHTELQLILKPRIPLIILSIWLFVLLLAFVGESDGNAMATKFIFRIWSLVILVLIVIQIFKIKIYFNSLASSVKNNVEISGRTEGN